MEPRPVMSTKSAIGSMICGALTIIFAGSKAGISWLQWMTPELYLMLIGVLGPATGIAFRAGTQKAETAGKMAYHESAQALMKQK